MAKSSLPIRVTKEPMYQSWKAMYFRCADLSNPAYGGRGIKVCERWHSFVDFVADMYPKPAGTTIERIDNNGNYEPGNCRWATRKEQANNRRLPNRRKASSTGVIGVTVSAGKYRARYRQETLGIFNNFDDAVAARRERELVL